MSCFVIVFNGVLNSYKNDNFRRERVCRLEGGMVQ